jgi:adenine deaminase
VTIDRFSRLADPEQRDDPAARLLPRHYRDVAWNWQDGPHFLRALSDEDLATMKREFVRMKEVVLRLHRAGVRVHLGTDTAAAPFVVPGVSLHEELGHMVDAGLTAEEAWAAATRTSGESLGVPLLGTVREGAPADLAIFGRDPTVDLAALSTLEGVIAQGRLYSRPFLDAALARHRERFERPVYDALTTALIRAGLKMMAAGN